MADVPYLQAKVLLNEERLPSAWVPDRIWGLLFVLTVLAEIALTVYVFISANTSGTYASRIINCPNNTYLKEYPIEMFKPNADVVRDICKCIDKKTTRRLEKKEYSLFSFFRKAPEVPALLIAGVVGVSLLWLVLMKSCATFFVVGTVITQIVLGFCSGGYLYHKEQYTSASIVSAISLIYLVYVVWRRQKFLNAAHFLEQAVGGIFARATMFFVLVPVQMIYLGILALLVNLMIFLTRSVNVTCKDGVAGTENKFTWLGIIIGGLLMWSAFYLKHASLFITSMSVGTWCFNQEPDHLALTSFVLAFSKSLPVIAVSSCVCAICEILRRFAQSKMAWISPFIILKLLCCCFADVIDTISRFVLVFHAITSESFWNSAKFSYAVLMKHLEDAYVTSFTGKMVVWLGNYAVSFGIGLAAWAWCDDQLGLNTLENNGGDWSHPIIFYLFFLLYMYAMSIPMFTLVCMIFFGNTETNEFVSMFSGLFVGSIANLVMHFVGEIVLCAVDTVYVCYAIQKEVGYLPDQTTDQGKIYYLLDASADEGPQDVKV